MCKREKKKLHQITKASKQIKSRTSVPNQALIRKYHMFTLHTKYRINGFNYITFITLHSQPQPPIYKIIEKKYLYYIYITT